MGLLVLLVVVMLLVRVVCNVQIQRGYVHVTLDLKGLNVMLLVDAMALGQVELPVIKPLVSVHAMLASKALRVILLVVVILLVQVAQLVMLLQGNVLVTLVTRVPHAIPAPPITTEQAMELVKVC